MSDVQTESPVPATKPAKKKRSALMQLLVVFGVMVVLAVGAGVAVAIASGIKSNSVLHLKITGEIPDVATDNPLAALLGNTTVDLWQMQRALRAAATDERILGVVLDVRDPEVGLSTIQELEQAMAAFRASGKWSVAFLETAGEFGPGT